MSAIAYAMEARGRTEPEVVAVCGAGAAGMAAALAAARAGADVCLIETQSQPGGTVANSLIHTIAGLYDSAGDFLNDGLSRELVDRLSKADPRVRKRRLGRTWVLNSCPDVYRAVVQRWISSERRIRLWLDGRVSKVIGRGDRVVEAEVSGRDGVSWLRIRAIIDATGTADVVRLIDPELLQNDTRRAAGGLIFRMQGVNPGALAFPKGLAIVRALSEAADNGMLPNECGKTWIDSGVDDDEIYVKLFIPLPADWRQQEEHGAITRHALEMQASVLSFLNGFPEFGRAYLSRTGALGVRDGGRVRGKHCLTGAEVRASARFDDAACRCAWPIEFWDPENGVSLEHLPDGHFYEIPLRALEVRGFSNVWAAGKCLSADHEAQASARAAGTCWSMGEAVGMAAAR
jgi:hypothetical protein